MLIQRPKQFPVASENLIGELNHQSVGNRTGPDSKKILKQFIFYPGVVGCSQTSVCNCRRPGGAIVAGHQNPRFNSLQRGTQKIRRQLNHIRGWRGGVTHDRVGLRNDIAELQVQRAPFKPRKRSYFGTRICYPNQVGNITPTILPYLLRSTDEYLESSPHGRVATAHSAGCHQ